MGDIPEGHRVGQAQDTQHGKAETDSCVFNTEAQSLAQDRAHYTAPWELCLGTERISRAFGVGSVGSVRSGTPVPTGGCGWLV